MRYTLKQIGYFVATGEAGSILRASENIHVSQPSISSAIAHLEEQFGVQLFVRHHAQGMSLTSAGRELLREAKALLARADHLQGFAGELAGRIIGSIEVGCFNPLAPVITPELCHGFMQRHPETAIPVREAHQAELLQLLRQGTIDIALTYDRQLQGDFHFEPLATLPPYVLLGAEHPRANETAISHESLAPEPMILLDLPLSRDFFMSLFHCRGLKPMIRARTRLTEVQRSLVACGRGYSLANVRPLNRISLDGNPLQYIPLEGQHATLTLGILTLADTQISMATRAFIENCRDKVGDNRIPGMAGGFA